LTEKKEEKPKPSYKRVVPIEYEANGVSLVELFKPDFVSKMEKTFGDFNVVNLIIILGGKDLLSLWHKSSEDAKNKTLTIASKDPETMQRLSEVLGLKGEAHD
jgi:hypothetical protein